MQEAVIKSISQVTTNFEKDFYKHELENKYHRISPFLDATVFNINISKPLQEKFDQSIRTNPNIYYFMNSEIFNKIIIYSFQPKKNALKTLNELKIDALKNKIPKELLYDKQMDDVFNMRYQAAIIRYLEFIINIIK